MIEPINRSELRKWKANIYVDQQTYKKLAKIKKRTGRSMNGVIVEIIRYYLEEVENEDRS